MADSTITIIGNLAADPEIRYLPNGNAVLKCRIGSKRNFQKGGEWTSKTSWWGVEAWGQLAENAAATFTKGMRIVVVGEVDSDEYTTESGEKRVSYYVRASSLGVDLRYATASVERNPREGESGGKPNSGNKPADGYGDNSPYNVGGDENEPF
jgi:single-strand DNA-binding protein